MRLLASCLIGITLGASLCLPACAEDFDDVANGVAMTGARIVKFTVGAFFGTPVAVARGIHKNTMKTIDSVSDKSENVAIKGAAVVVALPVGIFTGIPSGVYNGVNNSWKGSGDEKFKFSKEMFSLGEMKD